MGGRWNFARDHDKIVRRLVEVALKIDHGIIQGKHTRTALIGYAFRKGGGFASKMSRS